MCDDQEQMRELDELLHRAADSQLGSINAAIDVEARLQELLRRAASEDRGQSET
jgi:hypothetical protein